MSVFRVLFFDDDFREPSIVYQEVCGTLARRVDVDIADQARKQLDLIIHPSLVVNCDRAFCISAYSLCSEYHIYAVDAAYNLTEDHQKINDDELSKLRNAPS